MAQSSQTISTPDLCDDFPDQVHILEPIFRIYGGKTQFSGEITTVKCFEDNSRVKELAETNGDGRVMVVDAGGSLRHAMLGDMIAERLVENNWRGIIIDGCVRDVEALNQLAIGVRALNSVPIKSVRKGAGEVDVPIRVAGVNIKAGHHIYADESGIIVSDKPLV